MKNLWFQKCHLTRWFRRRLVVSLVTDCNKPGNSGMRFRRSCWNSEFFKDSGKLCSLKSLRPQLLGTSFYDFTTEHQYTQIPPTTLHAWFIFWSKLTHFHLNRIKLEVSNAPYWQYLFSFPFSHTHGPHSDQVSQLAAWIGFPNIAEIWHSANDYRNL